MRDRPGPAASRPSLRFPTSIRERILAGRERFIVTGAGGWFGQATLELLDEVLGASMPDRVAAFAASARPYGLRSGREIAIRPLASLRELPPAPVPTCLAHYAFLTREKLDGMPAETYIAANRHITSLTISEATRLGMAGVFTTSSGAVYDRSGQARATLADNPYGALKLEEEAAFGELAAAGARTAICRVFNVSGPFINKDYALSSFLRSALAGRDIQVAATKPVVRSYLHVRDIVSVGFAIMLGLADPPGKPYDTAGAEAVEVGELARRILSTLNGPELRILRDPVNRASDDRYVGDPTLFDGLAKQARIVPAGLDEQIRDTAADMCDRPARKAAQA